MSNYGTRSAPRNAIPAITRSEITLWAIGCAALLSVTQTDLSSDWMRGTVSVIALSGACAITTAIHQRDQRIITAHARAARLHAFKLELQANQAARASRRFNSELESIERDISESRLREIQDRADGVFA